MKNLNPKFLKKIRIKVNGLKLKVDEELDNEIYSDFQYDILGDIMIDICETIDE